jgi:hypothetical protein
MTRVFLSPKAQSKRGKEPRERGNDEEIKTVMIQDLESMSFS